MFDDAEQLANNNVGAKNAFEKFCSEMKAAKDDEEKMEKLTEADKTTLGVCIDLGDQFLEETKNATATDYEVKMKEIQEFYEPLLEKMAGEIEAYPEPKEIEAYPEPK